MDASLDSRLRGNDVVAMGMMWWQGNDVIEGEWGQGGL